jgi:hypothetical protein
VKKLCVIGDSHTSALKQGWHRIADDFTDIEVTFFSSHRRRFVHLAVRGDTLVPEDEELREVLMRSCVFEPVIASDYDRYILVGLDFSTYQLMKKLGGFRSEDQTADNRVLLSDECYRLAVTGCLRDSVSMQVARKIRAITERPLAIVPGPAISDANERKLYQRLHETGDCERIAKYFLAAAEVLAREVDATILHQPPETMSDPLRTLAIYGKDAPREFGDTPRPEDWKDYQHMNGEYGALVWRCLLATPGF